MRRYAPDHDEAQCAEPERATRGVQVTRIPPRAGGDPEASSCKYSVQARAALLGCSLLQSAVHLQPFLAVPEYRPLRVAASASQILLWRRPASSSTYPSSALAGAAHLDAPSTTRRISATGRLVDTPLRRRSSRLFLRPPQYPRRARARRAVPALPLSWTFQIQPRPSIRWPDHQGKTR